MTTREFPHLENSPIVEAVVELICVPQMKPTETEWGAAVRVRLPDYPVVKPMKAFELHTKLGAGQPPEQSTNDLGWNGFRLETEDHLQVAQFLRDRFIFSRLKPYRDWASFRADALRLWDVYADLAKPTASLRLGLRFINRVAMAAEVTVDPSPYLRFKLERPEGVDLPIAGFFHQDVLFDPAKGYEVRIVRTIQPPGTGEAAPQLIFDIDVAYPRTFDITSSEIGTRLEEMRLLKNRVFFGGITLEAQRRFE